MTTKFLRILSADAEVDADAKTFAELIPIFTIFYALNPNIMLTLLNQIRLMKY